MHLTMDKIRELANAYISEAILTDKQLAWKFHMGSCGMCYKKFLVACLVQEELTAQNVIASQSIFESELPEMETEAEMKEAEESRIYMEMDAYDN